MKKLLLILLAGLAIGCAKEESHSFKYTDDAGRQPLSVDVTAAAFSPDGKTLLLGHKITGGSRNSRPPFDELLVLRDVATGKKVRVFFGHKDWVTAVFFVPDGKRAVTASLEGTIKVWDVGTGKEIRTIIPYEKGGGIRVALSVALSADAKYVLSKGSENDGKEFCIRLKLWDVDSGKLVRAFERFRGDVESVAFAPNDKLAISGGDPSNDNNLHLWDVEAGKAIHMFHGTGDMTWAGTFAPDGKYLLSARRRNQWPTDGVHLVLWEISNRKETRVLDGHNGSILAAFFTPDGDKVLSCGTEGTLKLWHLISGQEIWSAAFPTRNTASPKGRNHPCTPRVFAVSPDGKLGFTESYDAPGGRLDLWDLVNGKLLRPLIPSQQ